MGLDDDMDMSENYGDVEYKQKILNNNSWGQAHNPDLSLSEYFTLPHLFWSDSGQSNRNFRNLVESGHLFHTYILHCTKQVQPE